MCVIVRDEVGLRAGSTKLLNDRCNIINKTDIESFLSSTHSIEEFVQIQRLALKSFKEALLKHFISSVRRTE